MYKMYTRFQPSLDVKGNRLLTNFDPEDWRVYELALNLYDKTEEKGLFLLTAEENLKVAGYNRTAIWCRLNCGDLSEFWRIQEKIEYNIERINKLERILK